MADAYPTPCVLIDGNIVARNIRKMADYTRSHGLALRPHVKTHKSTLLGQMQIGSGAIGLTAAKPGEALVMAEVADDLLLAYPAVTPAQVEVLAELAQRKTLRIAVDSSYAAERLSDAARSVGSTVGILVDVDVGHHRTGVQSAADALMLAQRVQSLPSLRLDGILCFPGHLIGPSAAREAGLLAVHQRLCEVIDLWRRSGLEAHIVSGGSTPTAFQSHLATSLNEIRPGTYLFNDMNCVYGECATLDDCAARIVTTVVSTAVPGQIVLDCGTKTLTSDRCGPAPDSGHGYVCEMPGAKIVKLSEEHAQVDVSGCSTIPKLGERVTIIPNHVCPCINLQDTLWWKQGDEPARPLSVSARGRSY